MFRKSYEDHTEPVKLRHRVRNKLEVAVFFGLCCLGISGCSRRANAEIRQVPDEASVQSAGNNDSGHMAEIVRFDDELDSYRPAKKNYNFYFTYKVDHPWWDAVAIGIEDAAKQYEEKGITID